MYMWYRPRPVRSWPSPRPLMGTHPASSEASRLALWSTRHISESSMLGRRVGRDGSAHTQPFLQRLDVSSLRSALPPDLVVGAVVPEPCTRATAGLYSIALQLPLPAYHARQALRLGHARVSSGPNFFRGRTTRIGDHYGVRRSIGRGRHVDCLLQVPAQIRLGLSNPASVSGRREAVWGGVTNVGLDTGPRELVAARSLSRLPGR